MDLKPEDNIRSGMEHVTANEGNLTVGDLLAGLDPGDLKICFAFLQQCVEGTRQDCGTTEYLDRDEKCISLSGLARDRFVKMLARLVKGQEGLSRWEIAFIRQVWHEYRGDWEGAVGAPLTESGR